MRTLIYLDESGDLGWSFKQPYQQGGSSRMLTIASVVCPEDKIKYLKRIVRGLYKKRKRPLKHELKSVDLNLADKRFFIAELLKLKQAHPDIHLLAITVDKQRVANKLRQDPNVLYNYMIKHLLLDMICSKKYVDLIPDARSEKVNASWNLRHYLQQMIFERNILLTVENESCNVTPMESCEHLELQFIDYYAGLVWSKYEFGVTLLNDFLLLDDVQNKKLFF